MNKWEDRPYKKRDTNKLENKFAVFSLRDNTIYKIACVDFRGQRFDLSGKTKTIYLRFVDGIMFDYTNPTEFDKYYNLHIEGLTRIETKEKIIKWLERDDNRLAIMEKEEN